MTKKIIIEYESEEILPKEIRYYFDEYKYGLFGLHNEPDKQYIGLSELRRRIIVWFADHQIKGHYK